MWSAPKRGWTLNLQRKEMIVKDDPMERSWDLVEVIGCWTLKIGWALNPEPEEDDGQEWSRENILESYGKWTGSQLWRWDGYWARSPKRMMVKDNQRERTWDLMEVSRYSGSEMWWGLNPKPKDDGQGWPYQVYCANRTYGMNSWVEIENVCVTWKSSGIQRRRLGGQWVQSPNEMVVQDDQRKDSGILSKWTDILCQQVSERLMYDVQWI